MKKRLVRDAGSVQNRVDSVRWTSLLPMGLWNTNLSTWSVVSNPLSRRADGIDRSDCVDYNLIHPPFAFLSGSTSRTPGTSTVRLSMIRG